MSVNVDSSFWRLRTLDRSATAVNGVATYIPIKVISQSGEFSEEDATATEVYIIEASQLLNFVIESFPLPTIVLNTVFFPPRRTLPGLSSLFTKRISWEANVDGKPTDPFNIDPSAPDDTYDNFLKVTIEYGTWAPTSGGEGDDNGSTFLEVSADAAGGFLYSNTPGTEQWELTTKDQNATPAVTAEVKEVNVPMTVREPLIEWTVRWSQIPAEFFYGGGNFTGETLLNRLRNNIGKVNSIIMSLFNNAPIDTILFTSFSIRQQFTWRAGFIGTPPIQLEMKFEEKNFESSENIMVTHQHFWRPSIGFRRLTINDEPALESADLNLLFSPQA